MTGRYAIHTGVYISIPPHSKWGVKLEERTLAQALHDAGYETAIVGKWHLGESSPAYRPTQRGFDHQYGLLAARIDYFTHEWDNELDWHRDDQPCHDEGYSTTLLAKEACRLIREKNPDKPLFLYLPFNAVHAKCQVPESYCQPYTNLHGPYRIYAGTTAAMDEAIGQVLAALDEKGIRDNTLIVFSSDNGGLEDKKFTHNGPLRSGKNAIYEGGVRLCACATWPSHIPAGITINEPIHAVDWYPTLVKLGGGSLDQKLPLDGLDIWPVLTQGAKSPHDAILLSGIHREETAIRMGDWKLLVGAIDKSSKESPIDDKDVKESPTAKPAGGKVELYNLATDIGEKHNLASEQPAKVEELRTRLDALLKTAVEPGQDAVQRKSKQPAIPE